MKKVLIVSGIMIVLILVLPMFVLGAKKPDSAQKAATIPTFIPIDERFHESTLPEPTGAEASEAPSFDEACKLRTCIKGETVEMDLGTYLRGVLAAEIPASFNQEAIKAQAVAARTYTLWKIKEGPSGSHPDADVCDYFGCCSAYASEEELREKWGEDFDSWMSKIDSALESTDGIAMTWEEEPILAVFHSSSALRTAASEEVWGGSLPYLVSVESPETDDDAPDYFSTVEFTAEEFKKLVMEKYPAADLSGDPDSWARILTLTGSGRVGLISLGGVEIEGTVARTLFSLRSACFTVKADAEKVVFTVAGFGHGVGLSQYGANTMAENGSLFDEILKHYYPGAELTMMILEEEPA
ncbi:MAG: stage II sporulation protein D [Oscillospiraceae bacterium]|jgi:stage II sporulation protein D